MTTGLRPLATDAPSRAGGSGAEAHARRRDGLWPWLFVLPLLSGITLFYVSHAAGSVRKMCDRVLVLESGHLNFDGDVEEGIRYLQYDDDADAVAKKGSVDEELGADI